MFRKGLLTAFKLPLNTIFSANRPTITTISTKAFRDNRPAITTYFLFKPIRWCEKLRPVHDSILAFTWVRFLQLDSDTVNFDQYFLLNWGKRKGWPQASWMGAETGWTQDLFGSRPHSFCLCCTAKNEVIFTKFPIFVFVSFLPYLLHLFLGSNLNCFWRCRWGFRYLFSIHSTILSQKTHNSFVAWCQQH
jgi:hypothetical protein